MRVTKLEYFRNEGDANMARDNSAGVAYSLVAGPTETISKIRLRVQIVWATELSMNVSNPLQEGVIFRKRMPGVQDPVDLAPPICGAADLLMVSDGPPSTEGLVITASVSLFYDTVVRNGESLEMLLSEDLSYLASLRIMAAHESETFDQNEME